MESEFQFTNPALVNLEFGVNEEFDIKEDKEVDLSINMSVQIDRKENRSEALVGLTFEIGSKQDNAPFYIKAVEKANFRWGEGLDNSMVDRLLNQNAPSLLLSYLRPVVVQITAASPFNAYNIPFINFTKISNQED